MNARHDVTRDILHMYLNCVTALQMVSKVDNTCLCGCDEVDVHISPCTLTEATLAVSSELDGVVTCKKPYNSYHNTGKFFLQIQLVCVF